MPSILQTLEKKTLDFQHVVTKEVDIVVKLLPIFSFIIPFIILYFLYPHSFEETWKGRTYYLFFIWLVFLETILSWEELQTSKNDKLKSARMGGFIIALSFPTIYVLIANFLGLNTAIEQLYVQNMGSGYEWWAQLMPLSVEYLVFGITFVVIKVITHGKKGLTDFSISASLLFTIGIFYIVDNFYPYGRLTPLQFPALPTTILAANVLNLMGYGTRISTITGTNYGWMPYLTAWNRNNPRQHAEFAIAWPCAGIESLILYSITVLLFLKKSDIKWWLRAIYFIIGAIVTYFINILRISTLFVIAINTGVASFETQRFHEYYGQLYSIIWIISYPLIIIGSQLLWRKLKNRKTSQEAQATISPATLSLKPSAM